MFQYVDVPQEEHHGQQSLNPNWPFEGMIEFQNVTMRYKPSFPAALRDISFRIEGGTQVGHKGFSETPAQFGFSDYIISFGIMRLIIC